MGEKRSWIYFLNRSYRSFLIIKMTEISDFETICIITDKKLPKNILLRDMTQFES